MEEGSKRLVLARSLDELERIVSETEVFFTEYQLGGQLRFVIDLVIEELFVNCVKYNLETSEDILIDLKCIEGGIEVDITDSGVERFDPTASPDVDIDAPLQDRTPGGLGVFLVMKMVDRISYEFKDGVSKISLRKYG